MDSLADPIRAFASRLDLARTLATDVAATLVEAVATRGRAAIAVSGGSTPALFFSELATRNIDWARVTVTLVDERFVDPASPRSNEGLVRRALLQGPANAARFVPLYHESPSVAQACSQAEAELEALSWPLDAVVLGMGADGHTASFFPDAKDLARLLDPSPTGYLHVVTAPSAGEARLTLTLARIAGARFIALHIEGAEKRAVLDDALAGTTRPPIRRVLECAAQPARIYWAP